MLRWFAVENFASFRERQVLDLREPEGTGPVRVAAVYGANASGKTNLLFALGMLRLLVAESAQRMQHGDPLPVTPFSLRREGAERPCTLELEFESEGAVWRYGASVTRERVEREWLLADGEVCFLRHRGEAGEDLVHVEGRFGEAGALAARTRENALFLSVCAQWNVSAATEVFVWLTERLRVLNGTRPEDFLFPTLDLLAAGGPEAEAVRAMLRQADTRIRDVEVRRETFADAAGKPRVRYGVETLHRLYDADGTAMPDQVVRLRLEQESSGTEKLLGLAGFLVSALRTGGVLIADELDARLHPALTARIVSLFRDAATNPHGAQLIFNTHDVFLLTRRGSGAPLLAADEVYFAEKDGAEGTRIYPMSDFRPSGDGHDDPGMLYLRGAYGAVPVMDGGLLRGEEA